MKAFLYAAFLFFSTLVISADLAELNLVDGSKIKGRIQSTTASEVIIASDLGTLRIALDKLTPDSRAQIAKVAKPDADALLARIAELEGKVSQLQQDNESLRRQLLAAKTPRTTEAPRSSQGTSTTPTTATAGVSYSLSSTGKRHNSNCRYFDSGKQCGANDGVPCKICGG